MHFTVNTIIFFAAMIATTHAAPANSTVTRSVKGWARFCDDANCSVNCGISVNVENPGCLIERGRGSVLYNGPYLGGIALLASPGESCGCQSSCVPHFWAISGSNTCLNLEDNPGSSYRFIHGGCPANNCE